MKHATIYALKKIKLIRYSSNTMTNYNKVSIQNGKETIFAYPEDIMYCRSEGNYTMMHLENGKTILASKNLKEIENILPASLFSRIHHGHMINLTFAKRLIEGDDDKVEMRDGRLLEVSRRKKNQFLSRFTKL